jgi:hypothetical protein
MKIIENLQYWFTPEGGDKYRDIVNNYYTYLISRSSTVEKIKFTEFDVLKLFDYPYKDMCTFITKELSSFILGNNEIGFTRQELAISLDSKYNHLNIDKILYFLSEKQLNQRDTFDKYEIIKLPENIIESFSNLKVKSALVAESVWFEDELQGFTGDINTNIIEILLITKNEEKLINNSIENFINNTQDGKIDLLNLNRS